MKRKKIWSNRPRHITVCIKMRAFVSGHIRHNCCFSLSALSQLQLGTLWSCDCFAFCAGNPSVCGDSPQHRRQQQTEGGDAEDQQVHLREREREKDVKNT